MDYYCVLGQETKHMKVSLSMVAYRALVQKSLDTIQKEEGGLLYSVLDSFSNAWESNWVRSDLQYEITLLNKLTDSLEVFDTIQMDYDQYKRILMCIEEHD